MTEIKDVNLAEFVRLYDNVSFGPNSRVEEFCIIGCGGSGKPTRIGENANIRAGTYIYSGNQVGDNFNTGNKTNIRENNTIGDNVSIGTLSTVEHHATIGNNVRIHSQCFIVEHVVIEDNVWIGPSVALLNAPYPANKNTKNELVPPTLKRGCIIGANSTIFPGVTIGEGALVGAGSLVTKDIAPGALVFGNPAKFHRNVSEIKNYD